MESAADPGYAILAKRFIGEAGKVVDLEKQIREYLRVHPEVREMLELVKMTEEEYCRALAAYQIPAAEVSTNGSTLTNVHIPGARRQPGTSTTSSAA